MSARTLRLAMLWLPLAAATVTPHTARAAAEAPPAETPVAAEMPVVAEEPVAATVVTAPVDVEVERVRPAKTKRPTLTFLKENRAFIRARFDLLRQRPGTGSAEAQEFDPRFLGYGDMLAHTLAAKDSTAAAEDAWRRRQLLASITELGDLEARLEAMERLLAEQRGRLGVLQADFTGRQETALMVLASGWPGDAVALSAITIVLEDGDTLTVALTPEQRESLRQGGMVQIAHTFVEPREQVVEVTLAGAAWPAGDAAFLTLEPARDRLTMLRLDLSPVRSGRGAAEIRASTWLHQAGIDPTDG
jgi:hypothetical protein